MKYLSIFKDVLGSIECPEHRQKPEIIKDESHELLFECCCPEFKKECVYLVNKIASLMAE
jgi:hypothetical protein